VGNILVEVEVKDRSVVLQLADDQLAARQQGDLVTAKIVAVKWPDDDSRG
jgi:hypothetical protein